MKSQLLKNLMLNLIIEEKNKNPSCVNLWFVISFN
jgi:hypothetical protein